MAEKINFSKHLERKSQVFEIFNRVFL